MGQGKGTRRRRIPLALRLRAWGENHVAAARETLAHLAAAPLATLLTVAAIAIALALPTALHLALVNVEGLGGDWQRSAAISVFLKPALDEAAAETIAERLRGRPDVVAVEVIPRAQGLAEFREYSGLAGALDALDDNPLPVVLSLYPIPDAAALDALTSALAALPEADFARLDAQWAERLAALLGLLHQALALLGGALVLAVLLVVGNTIRLEIENRRGQILIMDLVGATMAYIRRPFLYSGAWYGLLGGLLAWALVSTAVALLQAPVARVAALYHTSFSVAGLPPLRALALVGAATLLGIVGSWIAVGRHLRRIEPD